MDIRRWTLDSVRAASQFVHCVFADAARGAVDDALQRDRVIGIQRQLEIGNDVAHFQALIKREAADDVVLQPRATHRLFKHARLRIRAIQDGGAQVVLILAVFQYLCGNEARFRFRVKRLEVTHAIALWIRSPKVLALALDVVLHHGAGNVENCLRRTIVLFEPDRLRVGKVVLKVEDVGDVGAAPFVDRLIFIANYRDVLRFLRQQTNQRKLKRVCILVLINQDVAKLVVVLLAHFRNLAQESHGLDHQVVEVERVVRVQAFLVDLEDAGNRGAALVDVIGTRGKSCNIFAAVLCRADGGLSGAQAELLFVVAEVFDAVFDETQRVVLIIDGERAAVFVVELFDVLTQDAHAETVKGGDERHRREFLVMQQTLHALAHLLRGFVGKCDRENVPRRDAFFGDQVGDAMCDDARLA